MRPSNIDWALGVAILTSQRSTCYRRNVGAVLLNARGHIISTGVNGVAAGLLHCNEPVVSPPEDGRINSYANRCSGFCSKCVTNLDACQAIHAEQNALLQCRNVYEIHSCVVTTAPCVTCTKLLLNTTCQQIIFVDSYPQAVASKSLWESAKRQWNHVKAPISVLATGYNACATNDERLINIDTL